MSDVELSADSDEESSWETDVSLSDTDALSRSTADISGLSGDDDDQEIFLDYDDETNSLGSADVHVDVANMSDDEYEDSDSSSVQVLSEAEQLDVSSVVEVWTDRGDEHAGDDDERTVSPDATSPERGSSDTEIEENNEPQAADAPAVAARSDSPQVAQPVPGHERSVTDEEGTTCTICFETWTASGVHRLASLKCGHLYGLSCIERWVKGQRAKCPQCNAPARRADIRPIFAQKLMALDTVQLDQVVTELNAEREKRKRSEVDAELMRQKYKLLLNDYEKVKSEYSSLKKMRFDTTVSSHGDGVASGSSSSQRLSGIFTLDRAIDLGIGSGLACRNLAVSGVLNQLVVSQSRTGLFNGYGLRKVSLFDLKSSEYVLVHKGEIKDIAFHRRDALVLSASYDKSVKLTAMTSNSVVQTYHQPVEAWSCAWDKDDSNCFYVGLRNGSVFKYDMRVTSEAVCKLPSTNRYEPVVAMQHIPKGPSCTEDRCPAGLLVSQFQMCSFFETNSDTEFKVHPLHLEGNCISISYEHNTRHLLMSCRPTARTPYITHSICNLLFPMTDEGSRCAFNIVHVFNGGPTQVHLSRSCICLDPEDAANFWAVAGDESYKQVLVWDASSGKRIHQLDVTNPVLDVCPVTTPAGWGLAALAKNTLSLYSWKQRSS